jgi:hypothetical protein
MLLGMTLYQKTQLLVLFLSVLFNDTVSCPEYIAVAMEWV